MQRLYFEQMINASPHVVWSILWEDATYRKWTAVYSEGSYAVGAFREGSRIHFLGPDGSGIYSDVVRMAPEEQMRFKHIGEIKNFQEQEIATGESWYGAIEQYDLEEQESGTLLKMILDTTSSFAEFMKATCPKALARVRTLAETGGTGQIQISTTLEGVSKEKAWNAYTQPLSIEQWNFATEDWHCPRAIADLSEGGRFAYTMAAKDGSNSFDFTGSFTKVDPFDMLNYKLDDGRNVFINFLDENERVHVSVLFDAEDENPAELQREGWQAILDNYARFVQRTA